MADFRQAVLKTLAHEGGYVNNPHDRGGPTKYGITQSDMPGVNIADITQEQAIAFYAQKYWNSLYSQINDQALAEKLFDMGVLFGVKTAVRLLQISMQDKIQIVSDGIFGPETLEDVNRVGDLNSYRIVLHNHCINIVNQNPENSVFINGWINRINA